MDSARYRNDGKLSCSPPADQKVMHTPLRGGRPATMLAYHNPLTLFLCTAVIIVMWILFLTVPILALTLIGSPSELMTNLILSMWGISVVCMVILQSKIVKGFDTAGFTAHSEADVASR
jgi:hypothetical protein